MSHFDYDLIVIGAGSGGVRASRLAAAAGARVAVFEKQFLGGTCVNIGCIPKKLFVYGADYAESFKDAHAYGWKSTACFDWDVLRKNKDKEIERLNGLYDNMLKKAGVHLMMAEATLYDQHTVCAEGKKYTAQRILLVPGARPFVPDFPGSEHTIVSDDAFYLSELPKKAIIVGGGYIALEFASIFNGLGVETVVSYRRDLLLRGFDQTIRHHLDEELRKKGIAIHYNSQISRIEKEKRSAKKRVCWQDGTTTEADVVMMATGRIPNVASLGLEQVGIETRAQGEIVINEVYQTNIPHIYALGDVTGGMQLTPIALMEANYFVQQNYYDNRETLRYDRVPTAVFTLPNVAVVGQTEEQARAQNMDIEIYQSTFRHLQHTLPNNQEKTLMKVIVNKRDDRVIGCHMVGHDAAEIIQGLAVAMNVGATKKDFDRTIAIHPSAAEEFVTMRQPV